MTSTSECKASVAFRFGGTFKKISFLQLTTLIRSLPEIRSEGEGALTLPSINFKGHVAVKDSGCPRKNHPVQFTFEGNLMGIPQLLQITVGSNFFGLDTSAKEEIISHLGSAPKMVFLRIFEDLPPESFMWN